MGRAKNRYKGKAITTGEMVTKYGSDGRKGRQKDWVTEITEIMTGFDFKEIDIQKIVEATKKEMVSWDTNQTLFNKAYAKFKPLLKMALADPV